MNCPNAKLGRTVIVEHPRRSETHGTLILCVDCFVLPNQDARYLPECVEGEFCELRHDGVLRSSQRKL